MSACRNPLLLLLMGKWQWVHIFNARAHRVYIFLFSEFFLHKSTQFYCQWKIFFLLSKCIYCTVHIFMWHWIVYNTQCHWQSIWMQTCALWLLVTNKRCILIWDEWVSEVHCTWKTLLIEYHRFAFFCSLYFFLLFKPLWWHLLLFVIEKQDEILLVYFNVVRYICIYSIYN